MRVPKPNVRSLPTGHPLKIAELEKAVHAVGLLVATGQADDEKGATGMVEVLQAALIGLIKEQGPTAAAASVRGAFHVLDQVASQKGFALPTLERMRAYFSVVEGADAAKAAIDYLAAIPAAAGRES